LIRGNLLLELLIAAKLGWKGVGRYIYWVLTGMRWVC